MSLIEKFKNLNNFSKNLSYYDLFCKNKKVGIVHHKVAKDIINDIDEIKLEGRKLNFNTDNYKQLSQICERIADLLVVKKKIKKLSGEYFGCREAMSGRELFRLDRSLLEWLGIRGYGVHMIAFIKKKNSYKLWIPKRNKKKLVDPNKLDNTVAGGIKAGEGVYDALRREAYEEAGIKNSCLKKSKQVGTINYSWKNKFYTLRRDTLYLFDLEVDKNFVPYCVDGEVEEFQLLDWEKVLEIIQKTDKFKSNSALVVAYFLIRHGLLNSKNEKYYEEILRL